jgi:general secretion pathway protein M
MKSQIQKVWLARSPRERIIIAVLSAMLAVLLYTWLVVSTGQARADLRTTVPALRVQSILLDRQAIEYERLQASPGLTASRTGLTELVQGMIDEAGLARSLEHLDASGPDRIKVVFGAVAFAEWLKWIEDLEAQHVRVETCRIEALSSPGLVSVAASLVRPARP